MRRIDLNSDMGESFGPWRMGDDAGLMKVITSANIACGGHASDPETMFETLSLAKKHGVVVGAHPGYPDREGFGRRVIPMSEAEIERMVAAQIGALMGVAALAGASVRYVKAHGALGNLAAAERGVAGAVARATKAVDSSLALLAISGTRIEDAGRDEGLTVVSEIFADRAYLANGQLMPRSRPGAVLHDPDAIALRMVEVVRSGLMPTEGKPVALAAQSICVHGDTPGAVEAARKVRAALEKAGVALKAFVDA
jgi:UPF0271 protein